MDESGKRGVLRFRHGSRGVVVMGAGFMLSCAGLWYVAFSDPEASAQVRLVLLLVGSVLGLLGARLALGMQRIEIDPARRTWRVYGGLIMRYTDGGSVDQFNAVTVEPESRQRGTSHYTVHRVAILLYDGRDLFLSAPVHRENAVQMARAIARKLGFEVRELPDEEED